MRPNPKLAKRISKPKREKDARLLEEIKLLKKYLTGPAPSYKEEKIRENERSRTGAADLLAYGHVDAGGDIVRKWLGPDLMLYYGIMEIEGPESCCVPFRAVYRFGPIPDKIKKIKLC